MVSGEGEKGGDLPHMAASNHHHPLPRERYQQREPDGAALPSWAFLQGLPCRAIANPALKLPAVILTTYFDN